MKTPTLVFCVLFTGSTAIAQLQSQHGNIMAGANLINYSPYSYSWNKAFHSDGTTTTGQGTKNGIGLNLYYNFGYFVKDNLCLGMGMGKDHPGGIGIAFIPFVRHYFGDENNSFHADDKRGVAYMEYQLNLGVSQSNESTTRDNRDESRSSGKRFNVSPHVGLGYTYLLTQTLAIEGMISVNYAFHTSKSSGEFEEANGNISVSSSRSRGHHIGTNALIGLQIYFPKRMLK